MKKLRKKIRVTLNNVYSNNNTAFSNLIYKLEEETMLNELKQLIKASGRHTNVQKNIFYIQAYVCVCVCVCVYRIHSNTEEYAREKQCKKLRTNTFANINSPILL